MITMNNTKQEIFDAYELLLKENEEIKTDAYAIKKVAEYARANKMPFVYQKLSSLLK